MSEAVCRERATDIDACERDSLVALRFVDHRGVERGRQLWELAVAIVDPDLDEVDVARLAGEHQRREVRQGRFRFGQRRGVLRRIQQPHQPRVKRPELRLAVGVVEAEHLLPVRDLLEALRPVVADLSSRRIG